MITTFEEMFSNVQTGADDTKKAVALCTRNATQLQKAAQDGNIGGIRKANEQLSQSFNTLQQTVVNVASC